MSQPLTWKAGFQTYTTALPPGGKPEVLTLLSGFAMSSICVRPCTHFLMVEFGNDLKLTMYISNSYRATTVQIFLSSIHSPSTPVSVSTNFWEISGNVAAKCSCVHQLINNFVRMCFVAEQVVSGEGGRGVKKTGCLLECQSEEQEVWHVRVDFNKVTDKRRSSVLSVKCGRYVGTRRFRVRGQRTPEVNKVALTALKYFIALISATIIL